MSTGESGFPLVASGELIRQREFATVRRGYDPDQVHAFLMSIAAHVEALERGLADARARIQELEASPPPQAPDPYERLSKRFAGVLATADTEAEEIVGQARAEAARIKGEAQARAEELRLQSSHSLIAAQEESDRMLANLAKRREAMLRQLHEMQSRLLSVADDLEGAILPSSEPSGDEAEPPPPRASSPGSSSAPRPLPAPTADPGPGAPVEEPWPGPAEPAPEAGLAGLFDDPDDVDLPDLSGLDLGLDDERDAER